MKKKSCMNEVLSEQMPESKEYPKQKSKKQKSKSKKK
jgi:hypothetical protein